MCKTMKLKEQVICSQNTMVGQAWGTSYRALYSKRKKREGGKKRQHSQAALKCSWGINVRFKSLGLILCGFQFRPPDFWLFPLRLRIQPSRHPPVFIRSSMCLTLISFTSLAPNCGVWVGSIAFLHFDLSLLVQAGNVSAGIRISSPSWVSLACHRNPPR